MASDMKICTKQKYIFEYLYMEKNTLTDIDKCILNVFMF